jgi:hypothetical protein
VRSGSPWLRGFAGDALLAPRVPHEPTDHVGRSGRPAHDVKRIQTQRRVLAGVERAGGSSVIWTVQRTQQIGLLKALGALNAFVIRDAIGQLTLILVVTTGVVAIICRQ